MLELHLPKSPRAGEPSRKVTRRPLLKTTLLLALLIAVALGSAWWWNNSQGQEAERKAHAPKAVKPAPTQMAAQNAALTGNAGGNATATEAAAKVSPPVYDYAPGLAGLAGAGQVSQADGVVIAVPMRLGYPFGLAMDTHGNVLVADVGGAMHRITPDGQVGTASGGNMFGSPIGAVTDANGNVIVADWATGTVKSVSPDGTMSTTLASTATSPLLQNPTAVATDANGDIFVASNDNNSIVMIAPDGTVTTLTGTPGKSGAADGSLAEALFNKPRGLATDAAGNVYVADEGNSNIRKISPDGTVTTIAGGTSAGSADGMGAAASFAEPRGLTVDSAGDIFVADTNNDTIRKIAPDGTVTTIAGVPGQAGDSDGKAARALFDHPRGVSVDKSGNVYVTDTGNAAVRRIAPDGTVTTVASSNGR